MAEALFYHLEGQSLHDVLPTLLERTLARGWRAVVQVPDVEARDALDRHLWTYRDDSFLPHGPSGATHAARQPIALTTGEDNPNGANVRFCADGATPPDAAPYERLVILFSSDDDQALKRARALWPKLKGEGHACTYWQQSATGRWEQKA